MKVALFVHCFFPNHFYGTETHTLELARNLLALGHQPIVVTAIFPGEPTPGAFYPPTNMMIFQCIALIKLFVHRRVKDTYYQVALHNLDPGRPLRSDRHSPRHASDQSHRSIVGCRCRAEFGSGSNAHRFFGFCFNNKLVAADGSLCEGPNQKRSNCSACYLRALSGSGDVSLRRWAGSVQWARLAGSLLVSLANVNGVCLKEIGGGCT